MDDQLLRNSREAVADERIAAFENLFGDSGPILDRIERVLLEPRDTRRQLQ